MNWFLQERRHLMPTIRCLKVAFLLVTTYTYLYILRQAPGRISHKFYNNYVSNTAEGVNVGEISQYKHSTDSIAYGLPERSALCRFIYKYVTEGTIVMTFFGTGDTSMALNLYLTSFKRFNVTNHLFITADYLGCYKLKSSGAHCIQYLGKTVDGPVAYDIPESRNTTLIKPQIVLDFLKCSVAILVVHPDTVFFEDPLPFLRQYQDADITALSDLRVGEIASGFVLIRNTSGGLRLLKTILQMKTPSLKDNNDQAYLNKALKKLDPPIKLQRLPYNLFQLGNIFFGRSHRSFHGEQRGECIVIQDNYIEPTEAKIYRFKEYGIWFVDENGYYSNPKRKYIKYDNPIEFSVYGNDITQKMELISLKTALIIGRILNRTVILPKFHCYKVKRWITSYRQMCHFGNHFNLNTFRSHLPSSETYRETVFLQHPLVPERVKGSVSKQFLIDGPIWHQPNKGISSRPFDVKLMKPRNALLTSAEIKHWFLAESANVLQFYSLYNEFNKKDKKVRDFVRVLERAIHYLDTR